MGEFEKGIIAGGTIVSIILGLIIIVTSPPNPTYVCKTVDKRSTWNGEACVVIDSIPIKAGQHD